MTQKIWLADSSSTPFRVKDSRKFEDFASKHSLPVLEESAGAYYFADIFDERLEPPDMIPIDELVDKMSPHLESGELVIIHDASEGTFRRSLIFDSTGKYLFITDDTLENLFLHQFEQFSAVATSAEMMAALASGK